MLQPSETETSSVAAEIVLLFDRARELLIIQSQSEIAELNKENSKSQQLTENVQQERERVTTQLTTELSQLREELTTERLVTASLKDDLDSAAVSHG